MNEHASSTEAATSAASQAESDAESRAAGHGTEQHAVSHATSRHSGPHPGILAIVALGLTLASMLTRALLGGYALLVSPFSPAVVAYGSTELATARVSAMLLFGSGVPLGIYAATVYARQLRLGIRVPGPGISFFGGAVASIMLLVSALVGWTLGRPEIAGDPNVARMLSFLAFATGGFGFAIGMGLLIAGMAVPALILRLFPRWLAWVGLVIAALGELSFLGMALDPFQYLLPVVRFVGLVWLIMAGFLLPQTRAAANRPAGPTQV